MTIATKAGGRVPPRAGQTTTAAGDYRQLMILTDRPALFDPDIAELASLAKNLGFKIGIERFDLEENKFSSFVLE